MKKTIFNVFLFTTGAAIGSLVTWKLVKKKYERILQEEIDSFKATYALCMNGVSPEDVDEDPVVDTNIDEDDDFPESVKSEYTELARRYGNPSGDDTETVEEGEGDDFPYINGPVVISPEEFGNGNYDHDLYCLTYYADGILANDWWETLNIEETIGLEALEHFGDFTDEVVHVRNEREKADYEVARDPRNYADMIANDPLRRAYAD